MNRFFDLRLLSSATAAALAGVCIFAAAAPAATGDLTQKPGLAACFSETGTGGACVDGVALDSASSVTVSPDGTTAYVASWSSGAVAIFDRAGDGTLTQQPGTAGCVSETGTGGACADGVALLGSSSVAVSPDGTSAYVASYDSDAVTIFDRAPDGTLSQKPGTAGCVSETGAGPCADGVGLDGARSVTVSPDGASAYVVGGLIDAVAVFDRASNGTLTQKAGTAGCVSETGAGPCADGVALDAPVSVTISPDGTSAYVGSGNAVAVLDRAGNGTLTRKPGTAGCVSETGTGGACVDGVALDAVVSVGVSPDGTSAYAGSIFSNAVAVFDRAPNGTLTQKTGTAACISETGTGGACADGVALAGAYSVALSPDGTSIYVTSTFSGALTVFDRASDGTLTQKPGTAGCVSETGTGGACADGVALVGSTSVALSPDGTSVYVASFNSDTVAVFDREGAAAPTPPGVPPSAGGSPYLKLVGKAGRASSRVRVGCAGDEACEIVLTGVRELKRKTGRPNGNTEAKAIVGRSVDLAAGQSKTVRLRYASYLARAIERKNPIRPRIRVTAKQVGGKSKTISVFVKG